MNGSMLILNETQKRTPELDILEDCKYKCDLINHCIAESCFFFALCYRFQRLDTPNWPHWPKWDKKDIWSYQIFSLYVIANHCKKADGSDMDDFSRYDAARKCFFNGVRSDSRIMNTLAKDNKYARDMSKLIMVDKGFFLRKTQEVLDQHMTRDEAPRVVIPSPGGWGSQRLGRTSKMPIFATQ